MEMTELRNYSVKYVEGLEDRVKVLERVLVAAKDYWQHQFDDLYSGDSYDILDKAIAAADKEGQT